MIYFSKIIYQSIVALCKSTSLRIRRVNKYNKYKNRKGAADIVVFIMVRIINIMPSSVHLSYKGFPLKP